MVDSSAANTDLLKKKSCFPKRSAVYFPRELNTFFLQRRERENSDESVFRAGLFCSGQTAKNPGQFHLFAAQNSEQQFSESETS